MIVIYGPTSSGKTSLAVKLCKEFGGEIISADSRQIYIGADIGTGKSPAGSNQSQDIKKYSGHWIIDGVKIWGYDLTFPDKQFSAANFSKYALSKIAELESSGITPVLAGGTGFYIDTVLGLKKLSGVGPNIKLRVELEKLSIEDLFTRLESADPDRLKNIDTKNPIRLIRAIEVAESGGAKSSTNEFMPYSGDYRMIGLTADRDFLYSRVDKWVDAIWNVGLIDETKRLIHRGYANSDLLHGVIYKTAVGYIESKISNEDAIQRIKFDLHAYIRRQQIWFKKYAGTLFDISDLDYPGNVSQLLRKNPI